MNYYDNYELLKKIVIVMHKPTFLTDVSVSSTFSNMASRQIKERNNEKFTNAKISISHLI